MKINHRKSLLRHMQTKNLSGNSYNQHALWVKCSFFYIHLQHTLWHRILPGQAPRLWAKQHTPDILKDIFAVPKSYYTVCLMDNLSFTRQFNI